MKMAVFDFALRKKGVYGVLHIIILLLSLFLVISISIDTFKNIPFTRKLLIRRFNYGSVCFFFSILFWNFSYRKINYVICERTLFSCLQRSLTKNIIEYYHIITSPELSYFLRFVPLVRGGYALAIVVDGCRIIRHPACLFLT